MHDGTSIPPVKITSNMTSTLRRFGAYFLFCTISLSYISFKCDCLN